MPKSEAKKIADAKFNKKTYDHWAFEIRKDAVVNLSYIKAHAAEQGESVNGFIKRAIEETVERDLAARIL